MNLESRTAFLAALGLLGMAIALGSAAEPPAAQEGARAARVEAPEDKRWQAVAPGRVESISGEIKIGAPLIAPIAEVLVKAGDKVSAGEPLLRLSDKEAQAQLRGWIETMQLQGNVRFRWDADRALPVRGSYVPPTIVALDRAADLKEEVFGPILHVVRWRADALDGLLIDSEPLWFEVEKAAVASLGGVWSHQDQAACIGGTMDASCRYIIDLTGADISVDDLSDRLIDDLAQHFRGG